MNRKLWKMNEKLMNMDELKLIQQIVKENNLFEAIA